MLKCLTDEHICRTLRLAVVFFRRFFEVFPKTGWPHLYVVYVYILNVWVDFFFVSLSLSSFRPKPIWLYIQHKWNLLAAYICCTRYIHTLSFSFSRSLCDNSPSLWHWRLCCHQKYRPIRIRTFCHRIPFGRSSFRSHPNTYYHLPEIVVTEYSSPPLEIISFWVIANVLNKSAPSTFECDIK